MLESDNTGKENSVGMKEESILHQGDAKLMELIFCGKRVTRAVLVLYKYCPYFRDFVGICFDLVLMWRRLYFCPNFNLKNNEVIILNKS